MLYSQNFWISTQRAIRTKAAINVSQNERTHGKLDSQSKFSNCIYTRHALISKIQKKIYFQNCTEFFLLYNNNSSIIHIFIWCNWFFTWKHCLPCKSACSGTKDHCKYKGNNNNTLDTWSCRSWPENVFYTYHYPAYLCKQMTKGNGQAHCADMNFM